MTYKNKSTWPPAPVERLFVGTSGIVTVDQIVDAIDQPTEATPADWEAYKRSHPLPEAV